MSDRGHNTDEASIRKIFDEMDIGFRQRNSHAVSHLFAKDCVSFDLAPPLRSTLNAHDNGKALDAWFKTWKSPIATEQKDLKILVSKDFACSYGLQHMSGTKVDGEEVDVWTRITHIFKKENGAWKIAHAHASVPYYMDGSGSAALDLTPE